ncbi:hypothetical protein BB8028_0005g04230 [Beauveria bassiana]|uniref:Uncharacterized protein n=1 Tax=Beauveria bassiana TaxID=176275 RepID=A0A2S7YG45_BEABA|nr:hypothetical protein BB8028_0005g04230 [Beauveria bassiana]
MNDSSYPNDWDSLTRTRLLFFFFFFFFCFLLFTFYFFFFRPFSRPELRRHMLILSAYHCYYYPDSASYPTIARSACYQSIYHPT